MSRRPISDHWHAYLGVNVCGTWLPERARRSRTGRTKPSVRAGLHSHGDGLMHIHPFSSDEAGDEGHGRPVPQLRRLGAVRLLDQALGRHGAQERRQVRHGAERQAGRGPVDGRPVRQAVDRQAAQRATRRTTTRRTATSSRSTSCRRAAKLAEPPDAEKALANIRTSTGPPAMPGHHDGAGCHRRAGSTGATRVDRRHRPCHRARTTLQHPVKAVVLVGGRAPASVR